MGELIQEIVNPAVRALPELEPDESTEVAITKARAMERANVA